MNIYELMAAEELVDIHRKSGPDGATSVDDNVFLGAEFKIERYASEADFKAGKPYSVTRDGRATALMGLITNAGGDYMWARVATANASLTSTPFDSANSFLAVGSNTTSAVAGATALTSQTGNRKGMETGWPKKNGDSGFTAQDRKIQFKAIFGSSDGNSAWNEFGVFNASTGGTLLDIFNSIQGTKVSGQVWTLTVTITLT